VATFTTKIFKLKDGQGKGILVGGIDIPLQLIGLALVDEFTFSLDQS
jgi:hypothetical protein